MAVALVLLLTAQAPGDALEALADESRAVRERAVAWLVEQGTPASELVALLAHDDPRVVEGIAAVLRLRSDPAILAELARHADHPAGGRSEAAAATLVEIALHHRIALGDVHDGAAALLPRRLQRATDLFVRDLLASLRGLPSADTPHFYRPLYAGGSYAENALRRIAARPGGAALPRIHALHAYTRLVGLRAAPLLLELMDDAEPYVRESAAALVWRYGIQSGLEKLVALLESERVLQAGERTYAIAAAERLRKLGPRGAERLGPIVLRAPLGEAVAAAAALRAGQPKMGAAAIRARIRRLLHNERRTAGAGAGAALFEVRLGPLDADQRRKLEDSTYTLLRVAVEADRDKALALMEPLLSPANFPGGKEALRIRIVYPLLKKHRAPNAARVRFAASALRHDAALLRRYGLRILAGVPQDAWPSLRPAVERALRHGRESLRLAAAALLAPDPGALTVCVNALYDGDPVSAATAARLLKRARPDLPAVDPAAPVEARRRLARELARRIGSPRNDKE